MKNGQEKKKENERENENGKGGKRIKNGQEKKKENERKNENGNGGERMCVCKIKKCKQMKTQRFSPHCSMMRNYQAGNGLMAS